MWSGPLHVLVRFIPVRLSVPISARDPWHGAHDHPSVRQWSPEQIGRYGRARSSRARVLDGARIAGSGAMNLEDGVWRYVRPRTPRSEPSWLKWSCWLWGLPRPMTMQICADGRAGLSHGRPKQRHRPAGGTSAAALYPNRADASLGDTPCGCRARWRQLGAAVTGRTGPALRAPAD